MEVDGHLKLMALELSCRRLAQQAKILALGGTIVDFARLEKVDGMVLKSLEALDQEIAGAAAPAPKTAKKRLSAGALLDMLRGKDEEPPKGAPERSLDTPPTPEHALALRGVGDAWPTPDLLGFLSSQRKTGLLEVATATEVFTIEFESGDIVHAHVSRTLPEQRLGDVLVANGAIDRETLERVRGTKQKARLGELLLQGGYVTEEHLLAALQTQIQLLFNRLFVARASRFSFWGGPPVHAQGGMRLNAMALILEGARRFDEGNTVELETAVLAQPEPDANSAPEASPAPEPAPPPEIDAAKTD